MPLLENVRSVAGRLTQELGADARRPRKRRLLRARASSRGTTQSRAVARQRSVSRRAESTEALVEELFRLEARFSQRLSESFLPLERSLWLALRRRAVTRRLALVSSALDLAMKPQPELALLDFVALLAISRAALDRVWVQEGFAPAAAEIRKALDETSQEAWALAEQRFSREECARLERFLSDWIVRNAHVRSPEAIRFSEFSQALRARDPQHPDAVGMRAVLARAARTAERIDSVRLLGERSLHYAQRLPYLTRLHARAAILDTLNETIVFGSLLVGTVLTIYGAIRRFGSRRERLRFGR